MKKRKVIIAICVVLVVILAVTGIAFAVSSNNIEPDFTIEKISSEYFETDDSVIASVNGKEITEKDVIVVKYNSRPDNPVQKVIEQRAIAQLAEKDGFELSEEQKQKDRVAIEHYDSLNFGNTAEGQNFHDDLVRGYMELSIAVGYRGSLERKISNHEFVTDNKKINKKYEKYKRLDDKWKNSNEDDWSLFTKNWLLMEEIADDYINAEIEKMDIERY